MTHAHLRGYRHVAQRMGVEKAILVPLVVGDRALGEIGVANRANGNYDGNDLTTLKVIAAQTASALERLLLYEQTGENLNRRMDELDAISRVSNELAATVDLDRVLKIIITEAIEATNANNGTVVLLKRIDERVHENIHELNRRIGNADIIEDLADIEVEAAKRAVDTVLNC